MTMKLETVHVVISEWLNYSIIHSFYFGLVSCLICKLVNMPSDWWPRRYLFTFPMETSICPFHGRLIHSNEIWNMNFVEANDDWIFLYSFSQLGLSVGEFSSSLVHLDWLLRCDSNRTTFYNHKLWCSWISCFFNVVGVTWKNWSGMK